MPVIARIGQEHYATTITFDNHTMIADEPAHDGGTDLGPSPTEMVMAGLASCTAITVRMVADRNGWPLEGVVVAITSESSRTEETTHTTITRHITLLGEMDPARHERLMNVADACPVHRMLTGTVTVVTIRDGDSSSDGSDHA